MGIKEKINRTISEKGIKKPIDGDSPLIVLSMKDPEPEEPKGETALCPRCQKNTESNTNDKGEKFCADCGTKRNLV